MSVLMLGIETATALTSVALVHVELDDGAVEVLDERSHRDGRRHGEVLPQLIAKSLRITGHEPMDIGEVAVGVGPGAYTGLRVGIATAEAIALSLRIRVGGVVTLDELAFASRRTEPFVVVTDARRREVFYREYLDYRTPRGPAAVGRPDGLASEVDDLPVLAPDGTPALPGRLYDPCGEPSASDVCRVVADRMQRGLPEQPARPEYLRRPDVSPSSGPKSVLR